jgi:hypothetical protein
LEKPAGWEKCDCRQDKESEKNEVRGRAERKPRRSHQQVRRENCDDKSLFPFLSGAAQETGEHGQQRDGPVGYPTSGGGGLWVLMRLKLLHGISHELKSNAMVCESFFDSITAVTK